MIEETLRRQLEPIVRRRRHLYLARRLAVSWLVAAGVGLGLVGVSWLGVEGMVFLFAGLGAGVALVTILVVLASGRMQPDYRAAARTIEQEHPETKTLLLAAVEQEPERPDGRFGYLQQQVIRESLVHAIGHDWLASVPTRRLLLADASCMGALLLLLVILAQGLPRTAVLTPRGIGVVGLADHRIRVSPGDTEVESGAAVVVVARFEGRVPPQADLVYGEPDRPPQRIALNRSLDDPMFGGMIPDVRSDLVYHVEYAGKRTRDYTIRIYRNPQLVRADARIVYPAYTKLPEKVLEDARQVSVVEGSEITWTFLLNKPVAMARLAPKAGIAEALIVDNERPNVLTSSFTATETQRYELHLTDADGRSNKMPPRFVVEVHRNLPPELTPVFPNRDVIASPLEELSLEAMVSDDYGVTACGLTYSLVGEQSEQIAMDLADEPNEPLRIQHLLALEDLGAEPDQLLTYYFWADDMGPDGQSRRTTSDMYFAEVRHFEEIFRESQSSPNQQDQNQRPDQNQDGRQGDASAEQLARLQKQIITATWNIKRQVDPSGRIHEHKEDVDVVRQSQEDALQQARTALTQAEDPSAGDALQAAAGHMETSVERLAQTSDANSPPRLNEALTAEQAAYQQLLRLRRREHEVARAQNARANNANSARFEQQLQQLELTQEENRYETQRLAQSQDQARQREDLQVLNRLRDLARRQNEMSNRLREAEAALRQAQDEPQQEDVLRELKRLRDEQYEALRDVDELQQRMENPQNRRRMAETRERLNDSRSRIRQSAEQLEQGMLSNAITSATRAQRQLEQMRDELQRRTSGQFVNEMRNLRDRAQQLDERQDQISEQIEQQVQSRQRSLAGPETTQELAERIEQQRQRAQELTDEMKAVSDQAETSEPLLSRRLYDTLRRTNAENLDRALETTGELLRRNFLPQAGQIERQAGESIDRIRQDVEEAARGVLGDEAAALRRAQRELDELTRQVRDESARAGQEARPSSSDPNGPMGLAAGSRRLADGQGDPNNAQRRPGPPRDETQAQGDDRRTSEGGTDRQVAGGPGGAERRRETGFYGPLTGPDYGEWSDRLRDVEEMLSERDLRDELARVRDRARSVRSEFVRHGQEPQWDLVQAQITQPLDELRRRIGEELKRLASDESLVPIDRDPVPGRFSEAVRKYFESLGESDR